MVKKFGLSEDDISNCYFDYYSIGHILFGFITFLVTYCITSIFLIEPPIEWALISTIMVGVFWELFENTVLCNTNLKFGHRKDSVENCITDIIFVFIGGCCALILAYISLAQLIIGTIYFGITVYLIYEAVKKITKNITKHDKENENSN